ncbi:hypothetical protein QYE76_069728 [Lolium multiflorum]|uniref:Uncharacterized protein n=1 Tax=Lolium multiflorum TaxID=4521 RepID=A0AAD8SHZ8_LOLMU|nr:hypothetical protein QYE76_069728 [Lolium multiflorum]
MDENENAYNVDLELEVGVELSNAVEDIHEQALAHPVPAENCRHVLPRRRSSRCAAWHAPPSSAGASTSFFPALILRGSSSSPPQRQACPGGTRSNAPAGRRRTLARPPAAGNHLIVSMAKAKSMVKIAPRDATNSDQSRLQQVVEHLRARRWGGFDGAFGARRRRGGGTTGGSPAATTVPTRKRRPNPAAAVGWERGKEGATRKEARTNDMVFDSVMSFRDGEARKHLADPADPSPAMRPRSPPPPFHRSPRRRIPAACCLLLLLALLPPPPAAAMSSTRAITDNEIREKKNACYADIEKSSATEKENCVLRCASPECYNLIYGGDPLEEGELDYIRGQEYKYCMVKVSQLLQREVPQPYGCLFMMYFDDPSAHLPGQTSLARKVESHVVRHIVQVGDVNCIYLNVLHKLQHVRQPVQYDMVFDSVMSFRDGEARKHLADPADPSPAMRPRSPPPPFHRSPRRRIPAACCLLLLLALLPPPPAAAMSSTRAITDNEIREKKNACYADIENGLWGFACRSSATEKENCVLRCASPECYNLIYGGDPLEEGELDYIRGQEYKYCMVKLSLGESLDGVKGSFNYS